MSDTHEYHLYIANRNYSSWSLRAWLAARLAGIGFDERVEQFEYSINWQRFREFAPNGRVPCLHHLRAPSDTPLASPRVIWDSLAIIEYLAERHAQVWPQDAGARAWARSACAEMHSGFAELRNQCPMNCGLRVRPHNINDALTADLTRMDELWCDGLAAFGGPFLGGAQAGAVDAFFAPVAFRVQTYDLPMSAESAGYASRLLRLPAVEEWYAQAINETSREPVHEAESQEFGEVIADYRRSADG